tara:strand:- start:12363 stop:15395 length:3033 start_codon:yes stop_codon:yes gene_type:complete
MGFVATPEFPLYGDKVQFDPDEDTDGPSVGDIAGAFWRQENIIGSMLNQEVGLPKTKDDPNFDAYSFFTPDERLDKGFVINAMYSDNEDEIIAVRKQMERERADKQTMAEGGATSFVVGLPVMVADPISLLSIGGAVANTYRAGKGILSAAAVTGSVVGVETAAQEAALHTQQLTRTFGESAINIGAATLLGGVLGATAQKLSGYGIDQKFIDEYADVMEVEPKINNGINPTTNAPAEGLDSVGAMRTFGSTQVSGKIPRALTTLLRRFDPLSRSITADKNIVRVIASMMAENPTMMDGPIVQAAESLAKAHSGKLGVSLQRNADLFAEYKETGGLLTRKEFNVAVARAIRTGDSDVPQIKQSADTWNAELYTPLKDDMIELGLLPKDVQVKTAANYLNRVWNKNKILSNYSGFTNTVSKWLADKDVDLYAKAAAASKKVGTATGKEQKELQALIDKAEFKQGRDLEAQDYASIAEEIAQRIIGSPDGRLPYDWTLGKGSPGGGVNNQGISGTALRGPLRNRVFQIDDELVEEFLENDIEILGARYLQNVAGDIELTRKFGDVNMTDQLKEITRSYQADLQAAGKDTPEGMKIQAKLAGHIEDISGMRDRIRGVYGFSEDNIWTRMARSSRDLNYLRLLGGVTVSSLPDVARVFMAEGFVKTFSAGLAPLVSNTKAFKIAAAEAKRYGVGDDVIKSGRSDVIADVNDYTQGGTIVERGLRSAVSKFGKINMLDYWTSGIKQLHAVTMQTSIFDGLSKGKYDKRLARLGISEADARNMWLQVDKHGTKIDGVWITNAKNWDVPELERMWGVAVRKESDRVIIIPGQEKPLFMSSELGKTIGQFRSFTLSATQRVFIAGLQNQDHNAVGGFAALASMGMFSYYLKQKIAGREVSDDPAVWAMEGIDRSGAVGILGEINNTIEKISGNNAGARALLGIDAPASRFVSRSVAESMLGPTFGSLLSTTVAASNAITSEGPMTESDVRTLRRLVPLQNLFYLRRGFDAIQNSAADL